VMDAIRVLVAQHRAIDALFDEVERETRRRARASAISRLAEELIAHMAAEEAVFYPAARRILDAAEGSARCRDEHLMLRIELRRVLETGVAEPSFVARIEALRALFEEHVSEEEAELFPRVERSVPKAELEVWGAEILASRPKVWIVTTEARTPMPSTQPWALRSRVSLPIPSSRG
jgi:hemerythrin superfamily protein